MQKELAIYEQAVVKQGPRVLLCRRVGRSGLPFTYRMRFINARLRWLQVVHPWFAPAQRCADSPTIYPRSRPCGASLLLFRASPHSRLWGAVPKNGPRA